MESHQRALARFEGVLVEDKVKIISLISCKFVVASDCNRNMVNIGRNHGQEQWRQRRQLVSMIA